MSADSRLVVVSPHLDDAVLSAASQLMRPGVRVVTVCTGEPEAGTPLAWWDRLTGATDPVVRVKDRLVEDDRALATLGVTDVVRLGFPDGQHVASRAARPTHEALRDALRPHLAGATEVWAPAGIGCHADHLAARDVAMAAVDDDVMVHHYADVPYSLRYGWPPSVTGAAPGSPYLDVEQWLAEELAATRLAETGLAETGLGHGLDAGPPTPLVRSVHRLNSEAQRRKVAAMACYVTQIPALDFGGALASGDPAVVGFEVSWARS